MNKRALVLKSVTEAGWISIHQAQQETGLPKETLRAWERRYGFPRPRRDANDERRYAPSEIEKLQLLKRLIDRGARPSTIVHLANAELLQRIAAASADANHGRPAPHLAPFLTELKAHNDGALRAALMSAMHRQGLELFVVDTIAPLANAVGAAWTAGELAIFEEHLFSEIVQGILRSAIGALAAREARPRVLLTTPPGEQHEIGLLMVHALLALEGVSCVSLGRETPFAEIVRASDHHRVDVVALSISGAFPSAEAARAVALLAARLGGSIELWVGGAGAPAPHPGRARQRRMSSLHEIRLAVQAWRVAHARGEERDDRHDSG